MAAAMPLPPENLSQTIQLWPTTAVSPAAITQAGSKSKRPQAIATDHEALRIAARQAHQAELVRSAQAADLPPSATTPTEVNAPLAKRLSEIDQAEAGAYLKQSILGRLGRWIEPVVRLQASRNDLPPSPPTRRRWLYGSSPRQPVWSIRSWTGARRVPGGWHC